MRPQDIAILLKICALKNDNWSLVPLSNSLHISISEISESLNRSREAKLIDSSKKKVMRQNLIEFIEHGLTYVFPLRPGELLRGTPTALSHPEIKKVFEGELNYVWPNTDGELIGLSIVPLYSKQSKAVKTDPEYYMLLCLLDIIRIGKKREVIFAIERLKKILS